MLSLCEQVQGIKYISQQQRRQQMSENLNETRYQCLDCESIFEGMVDECPVCGEGGECIVDETSPFFIEPEEYESRPDTLLPWIKEVGPTLGDIALWHRRANGEMTVQDYLNEQSDRRYCM
jgi:hypothetical protein